MLLPLLLSGFLDVVFLAWVALVSIPALTAAVALALIFFVVNLFRRRWRAAMSIVTASAAFALPVQVSLMFRDE
jgi:hypothetical protein